MVAFGLASAALVWGCAGELDKDPTTFANALANGGATGGSQATTGGTGSTSGGTGATSGGTESTTGGSSSVVPPDDACVASVLMNNGCTGCHNANTVSIPTLGAGLALDGANLGQRLRTTKATYASVTKNADKCVKDALIIDPTAPSNSILLKKVSNSQVCGDPMPQSGGLSGSDLQCITDWINKF